MDRKRGLASIIAVMAVAFGAAQYVQSDATTAQAASVVLPRPVVPHAPRAEEPSLIKVSIEKTQKSGQMLCTSLQVISWIETINNTILT